MMFQIAASLAAILTTTATTPSQPQPEATVILPSPERSALGVAQQLHAGLSVTPVRIVEDSRCPADVLCVQAGRLVVSILIERDGQASTETVELGGSAPVTGGLIRFADASVRRIAAHDGEAEQAYAFRFTYVPSVAS